MIKNPRNHAITQEQWMKVIMQLSPTGMKNLENSLRQVRGAPIFANENGGNSSPVSSTGGSAPSVSYRKGKTYEDGRRNLKDEPVSDEEAQRRYKRRERNRVAAAKCRQRRQSQIDVLQIRINGLRKTGNELQNQLRSLSREKNDLSRVITGHNCQMANRQQHNQPEQQHDTVLSDGLVSMDTDYSFVEPIIESVGPIKTETLPSNPGSPVVTRPSSLPLTNYETQALPQLSPLFTPSTVGFLNSVGSDSIEVQAGASGTTPTGSEYMYQSIGYLNLLSPSLEHVNLGMFASMDNTQLNTPIN